MSKAAVFGLRSTENYKDPLEGPRIATRSTMASAVADNSFLFGRAILPEVAGSIISRCLSTGRRHKLTGYLATAGAAIRGMPVIRNPHLYFTEGVTWTRVGNHVAAKARLQPLCVFDSDSVRLTPLSGTMSPLSFLAVFNSDIFSFLKMRFFQHTAKWEIGNLRRIIDCDSVRRSARQVRRACTTLHRRETCRVHQRFADERVRRPHAQCRRRIRVGCPGAISTRRARFLYSRRRATALPSLKEP